jgi:enoyl-CoA hydratase/carnithine racemase
MYKNLLFEERGGIVVITINRPSVRNALNAETVRELGEAFARVKSSESARAVILTGAGDKAFVAGADIAELSSQNMTDGREFSFAIQSVFDSIEQLGKAVIAAINGYALGGGCELAMACTLRIASDVAVFGQPEVRLGLIPGAGGTQRLPRLIGKGPALQMLLTGDMVPAVEALRLGLVTQVVPAADLMSAAEGIAKKITANAPLAVRFCIEAVNRGMETTQGEGLFLEGTLFGLCCGTADMKEGTTAFIEKRAPDFNGK